MVVVVQHGDASPAQLERLGSSWAVNKSEAERLPTTGPACARLAESAIATAAIARRLHRADTADQVIAQTLAALKAACELQPKEIARHVAFARVLEAAAWHEQRDARASFDALRAAAAVLGGFAETVNEAGGNPLARLAVTTGLLRPLMNAARMLDDTQLRHETWTRCWQAALRWANASNNGPDHAQAVEWVVLLAFELATDELHSSAAACLERCEDLRNHLDALDTARNRDAVCLLHRSAFLRLWSDAWLRLGDPGEAERALDNCGAVLAELDALRDGDHVALSAQNAALQRDRERLATLTAESRSTTAAGA